MVKINKITGGRKHIREKLSNKNLLNAFISE